MTNSFSTSGMGWLCGSPERLVLVDGGWGTFVIDHPLISEVRFEVEQPLEYETLDGGRHVTARRDGITLQLTIVSGGAYHRMDGVPDDLRLADDMTVRQLLGTVYRKLQERKEA